MDTQEKPASLRARASGKGGRGKYFWFSLALWTLGIAGLLVKDIRYIRERTLEIASVEARIHLNKDMAARFWAASHGGFYVPISQTTPPNQHLDHLPERDIRTPSGKALTLMNPAYMLRQMMEHYAGLYGARGHITSLKHFRNETAPDEWERDALLSFSRGVEEACEVCEIRGEPYLRIMRPIYTEQDCLKCHGFQGYRVGEVRGGISMSVPMVHHLERQRKDTLHHTLSYALLWFMGIVTIWFTGRALMRRTRERDRSEDFLRRSERNYSNLVENSLAGIYVNLDGKIVFANSMLANMFGYTVEELTGMDYLALVHPEDRERVAGYRDRRSRGLDAPADYLVRGLTKGGEILWIKKRNTLSEYEGHLAILSNVEDVTEARRNARRLEDSEAMLKELSARLLHAHEEERKRIAYEIHEGLAQTLSAAKFRMESILADLKGEGHLKAIHIMQPAIDILRESIATVRQIAQRLRPAILDELGILPALAWLCRRVKADHPGLAVQSRLEVEETEVPEHLKVVIYRILERALDGIAAPRDGGLAEVSLKREGDRLDLTVWSNGTGFLAEANHLEKAAPGRADFATIQERCMLSGGSLSIHSHAEGGAGLSVSWPVDKAAHGDPGAQ